MHSNSWAEFRAQISMNDIYRGIEKSEIDMVNEGISYFMQSVLKYEAHINPLDHSKSTPSHILTYEDFKTFTEVGLLPDFMWLPMFEQKKSS